ncbi:MAG: PfkB family carbohydrate kinase, partial [Pseudonocardia sp.]|nr:PfkB family carbohydrate kinase [Pseudonocardia sp.]
VLDGVATGVALIVVDGVGENQIAVGAGANAAVTPAAVSAAVSAAVGAAAGSGAGVGCVLVSTEIPGGAVAAAVRGAATAGVTCVLNPAPVVPAVAELFDAGPILTPNRSECLDLAAQLGHAGGSAGGDRVGPVPAALVAAAAAVQARTGAPVVVTLGGDGALIVSADGTAEHVGPLRATVRDTTGAGDTFNGVLAARLAAGDELGDAVRTAVVAASLSVTRTGARDGMPGAAAITAALADQDPGVP